jgi:hypothetical protein
MNIFDVAGFLVCIVLAAAGWFLAGHLTGKWYFAAMGAAIGLFAPYLAIRLFDAIKGHSPPLPVCENPACGRREYRVICRTENGVEYECHCGARYKYRGREFLCLDRHGIERRYKRLNNSQEWDNV